MSRNHNESSVSTASRTIQGPLSASPQEAQFVKGSSSCLSLERATSSDSVMIAPSLCGTPPRKRWEGAFNMFLRGKNPEQTSPTLSSSPCSSGGGSMPVVEDLSTGTSASLSSSSGISGGMKAHKKKSSFSLIPGSRRLVSRNGNNNKGSALPSMFSKGGSSGHLGNMFSRSHKSMDALDVPLRKGMGRSKSNAGVDSNDLDSSSKRRERSSSRSSPVTTQPPLASSVQQYSAGGPLSGFVLQRREQQRSDNYGTASISTTPPTSTSALNDQLMSFGISSNHAHVHPNPPNGQIERTYSGDWHINPIVNEGVEHPLATASAPSLTQLQPPPRRTHSRTYMYSSSSNSNSNTPVQQYQSPYQNQLDLHMMPELPSLSRRVSSHKMGSSSDFHDVGLNLDDPDNCNMDDGNQQHRQDQLQPHVLLGNSATTIITDDGVPEPPESLDEILAGIGGSVTIHSSGSSHLLKQMDHHHHQIAASPATKKAFTKIHNSAEYGQDISPFLGGQHASNLDLAGAHRSCIATQQSMLLRSINSNKDINSLMQFGSLPRNSPSSFLSHSLPLDKLSNQNPANEDSRLLKPIQSADSWAQGRRYLIAPAALAACPLSTIKNLTGSSTQSATEAAMSTGPPEASGGIVLGDALMTYVGDKYHITCGRWSSCKLVLRQNYLFEYDLSAPLNSLPRGIAHLKHAVAHSQENFEDALELHFYSSPCAKVDQRVLLIRVNNKDEREHWITCLNKAARLRIKDIWEYDENCVLGSGRYASIVPARRKMAKTSIGEEEHRGDQERVQDDDGVSRCALKIIDKNEFWRLVAKGRERCDTIVRELAVQSTLTAKFGTKPTFLKIHGFFETAEKVVIELELLDGKDLFEYISSKGVLEEEEAGLIIRDILVALNSMSRAGIAHRDIKPANILMTKCDECKYGTSVKLGDFGMSTLVGVDGLVRGRCGSPGYVAPEILKAEAGQGYQNQVDMFSAGVTLYLMLCGYEPFYGESEKELIKANKKADYDFPDSEWSKISPEAKNLVAQMLKTDPSERITAEEAVEHPWIVRLAEDQKRYSSRQPENSTDTSRDSELEEGVCAIM